MLQYYLSRRKFILLAVILIVMSGAVFATRGFGNRGRAQVIQPALPIALAHVPVGIPIALSNFSVVNDDEPNGKKPFLKEFVFRAVALGGNSLTSLNFTVFEFSAQGNLRRVSSFVREQEGVRQGAVEIALPLARRFQPDDRLVLAVDRVADGARNWEVDFNDLARQAANVAKGRPTELIDVKQNPAREADFGPVLCLNGLRRARALAQPASPTERPAQITSFSCDQNVRSFAFSINGKNL